MTGALEQGIDQTPVGRVERLDIDSMNVPPRLNPDQLHRHRQPQNHKLRRDEMKETLERGKGTKGLMEIKQEDHNTRVDCSVIKKREAKEAEGAVGGRKVDTRGAEGVVGITPTAKGRFPNVSKRRERWIVGGPRQRREEEMSSGHWICSAERNQ